MRAAAAASPDRSCSALARSRPRGSRSARPDRRPSQGRSPGPPRGSWPDPDKIHAEAQVNGLEMVAYLVGLIAIREGEIALRLNKNDPVTRLLQLASSHALRFDLKRVILNTAG